MSPYQVIIFNDLRLHFHGISKHTAMEESASFKTYEPETHTICMPVLQKMTRTPWWDQVRLESRLWVERNYTMS